MIHERAGEYIAHLRKQAGITKTRLAEDANINVDIISKAERGLYGLKLEVFEKILHSMGYKLVITRLGAAKKND